MHLHLYLFIYTYPIYNKTIPDPNPTSNPNPISNPNPNLNLKPKYAKYKTKTHLTKKATFSNFGGTWPKYFVLQMVDYMTVSECSIDKHECVTDAGKAHCKEVGGTNPSIYLCYITKKL